MPVLLDAKDLAKIDQEFAAESVVWSILAEGTDGITEADFIGANEVRINKMSGFAAANYIRNADNPRVKLNVTKETVKLMNERWMAYDLDALDQGENAGLDVTRVVGEHARLVSIPGKDAVAIKRLYEGSTKKVTETITADNALDAFDEAEQYMTDNGFSGPYVMFVSSGYYRALKNSPGVERTFSVNQMHLGGIDRSVTMLDNGIPIVRVPAERLQADASKSLNFILLPVRAVAAVEKYNDVTLVPASCDRDGYRDTIKGLNYFDLILYDNASDAVYVSHTAA